MSNGAGPEEERMWRALQMAQHGVSQDDIAQELGASSSEQVQEWIEEASRIARIRQAEAVERSELARPASGSRSQDAAALLDADQSDDPLIEVWASELPDWTLEVGLNDLASHVFEDLVEKMVGFLERLDGIEAVLHEDRELVLVSGTVGRAELTRILTEWWSSALAPEIEQ